MSPGPAVQTMQKNLKQAVFFFLKKPFFAEALGKVHVNGADDKRQTNVTGHEPPLLSNEIKWQLLS